MGNQTHENGMARQTDLTDYTREELEAAADHLAAMHDELLARGWVRQELITPAGEVCLHGADCAVRIEGFSWEMYQEITGRMESTDHFVDMNPVVFRALKGEVPRGWPLANHLFSWNDHWDRQIDEVFDLVRNAEKKCREIAGEK